METVLGLVGGTMGLLTGFSILSGVEIVFYIVKFFMSLRIPSAERAPPELLRSFVQTSGTKENCSVSVT